MKRINFMNDFVVSLVMFYFYTNSFENSIFRIFKNY